MKLSKTNKQIKSHATITVRQVVANVLNVKTTDITNKTKLSYFDAMAATFDLHHVYPYIYFPEGTFDRYCRVDRLERYVCTHLMNPKSR